MVQISLQDKSRGITLLKVYGVNKGIDTIVQSEKQIIKPIITSEVKGVNHNKSGIGLGMSLLPDKPIPQQPQYIAQPKVVLEVSLPEWFRTQDKFIPVPWVRSREDPMSRIVNGENIWNISNEIPPYADPIYRPPPRPPDIPLQERWTVQT